MLVNRIRISNSIDKKLFEELKKLSEETKVPMSRLLDEAIEDLLNKRKWCRYRQEVDFYNKNNVDK